MTRYADAGAIPLELMDTSERDGTEDTAREGDGRRSYCPVRFSCHARYRGARRNVVSDAVEYVLAHGRPVHRTGVVFYFLARRDVPPADLRLGWATRLIGTVVMVSRDGEVITIYRNRRALHSIRCKMKYRLPELSTSRAPRPAAADARAAGDTERATA